MNHESKPCIHLVCNAHIDPVWLWEWEEGVNVAISTFRTAVELCEKDETFIFNHNEALLYRWIETYDPELFDRIRALVRAGRWHIMGGWYLQPDCNMPSGESFVRQILSGRRYFQERFGARPTTAINFDPFGHSRGLVQILAKSGYDAYLFGRPFQVDCPLEADDFTWVGFDGSRVMATRFENWYNSPLGRAREKIEKWMSDHPKEQLGIILWGVGNHGGGPSRLDLRRVNNLIASTQATEIRHSCPEAYFQHLRTSGRPLPEHRKDLNPWAVGCYSSQIRIKQKHRRLENQLFMLEKMATAATVEGLMPYPRQAIGQALHDLMMAQFHDILPGSSIEPVEEASLRLLDHGLEIVAREKARSFFALASGQKKARTGEIPILVYNPHPFGIDVTLECELHLPDFQPPETFTDVHVFDRGRPVPCQVEQEQSSLAVDWRKKVAFKATLQPSQMNRFDCRLEAGARRRPPALPVRRGMMKFRTETLEIDINTQTGLIDRYRIEGRDYLAANALRPIVMRDNADPWGMLTQSFRKKIGQFRLASPQRSARLASIADAALDPVRVIEDGPARTIVEALFVYGHSSLCQRYILPKSGTEIEIQSRIYWNEKDRMLKLSVPMKAGMNRFVGQTAFGTTELPSDGTEAVAQKWVAALSDEDDRCLSFINNGTYGSDFKNNELRLTLLRSPAYACHPHNGELLTPVSDRFTARMEQGHRQFTFWLNGGRATDRLAAVDREALVRNETPTVLCFFPSGRGKRPGRLAILSDPVVQISAIKLAEDSDDVIVRLFEPTGAARKTTLTLPALEKKVPISLTGFEIKTIRVVRDEHDVTAVNLMEEPIPTT